MPFPGQVFTPDYKYQPRWPWGQDGSLRIVSCEAGESFPAGVLVQDDGAGHIQVARDLTRLVGVSVYDPDHFYHDVVYEQYDEVPVMRVGRCYCSFVTNQPPYANPGPGQAVRFYAGAGQGVFTTDASGTMTTPKIVFAMALRDYYNTSAGSPAKDIPFPVPPLPPGITNTTFGSGVALVEINLP